MGFEVSSPKAPQQNKLQALADRLATAKKQIAEGNAGEDGVKADFYKLIDDAYGPDTYLIYEARDPHKSWRMVREISEPRSFDLEGLRKELTPRQFDAITKTSIDTDALDSALKRGEVDKGIVDKHTTRSSRARLLWKPAGTTSDVHLLPGQVAVAR